MEYFSAKDKNLAIKIFDLGLKRFGDKAEYVRIYMEFMSNMNDDNNTRWIFLINLIFQIHFYQEFSTNASSTRIRPTTKWRPSGPSISSSSVTWAICNQCTRCRFLICLFSNFYFKVENRRIEKILHQEATTDEPTKKSEGRKESALLIDRFVFVSNSTHIT